MAIHVIEPLSHRLSLFSAGVSGAENGDEHTALKTGVLKENYRK